VILLKYDDTCIYTDFKDKIFGEEDISMSHYSAYGRISVKSYESIYFQVVCFTMLSPQTTTFLFKVQNVKELIEWQEISRLAYII
jgi:hypothetical protein